MDNKSDTSRPRLAGYRKILVGVLVHASTTGALVAGDLPADVYGDLTTALIIALLGSNVAAKFAHVLENKRYGTKPAQNP